MSEKGNGAAGQSFVTNGRFGNFLACSSRLTPCLSGSAVWLPICMDTGVNVLGASQWPLPCTPHQPEAVLHRPESPDGTPERVRREAHGDLGPFLFGEEPGSESPAAAPQLGWLQAAWEQHRLDETPTLLPEAGLELVLWRVLGAAALPSGGRVCPALDGEIFPPAHPHSDTPIAADHAPRVNSGEAWMPRTPGAQLGNDQRPSVPQEPLKEGSFSAPISEHPSAPSASPPEGEPLRQALESRTPSPEPRGFFPSVVRAAVPSPLAGMELAFVARILPRVAVPAVAGASDKETSQSPHRLETGILWRQPAPSFGTVVPVKDSVYGDRPAAPAGPVAPQQPAAPSGHFGWGVPFPETVVERTPGAQPALVQRGESRVREALLPPPNGRTEPVLSRSAGPVREIALRISEAGGEKVQLRVKERAGEIRVAVHSRDTSLARDLRESLPELVARLGERGFRAEAWRPAGAGNPFQADGRVEASRFADWPGDSGRDTGGGRGDSGERRQQDEPPQQPDESRWSEFLQAGLAEDIVYREETT